MISSLTVTFPSFAQEYFRYRAVLTPLNVDAAAGNEYVLSQLPGKTVVSSSIDTLPPDASRWMQAQFPTEVLNAASPNDLPPHELLLKPYCVVMLLINLDRSNGRGFKLSYKCSM